MKILTARLTVKDGHLSQALELLHRYAAIVRQESGNIRFDSYISDGRPDQIVVVEQYRDEAAFRVHLAGHEGKTFNEGVASHLARPVELEFLSPTAEGARPPTQTGFGARGA